MSGHGQHKRQAQMSNQEQNFKMIDGDDGITLTPHVVDSLYNRKSFNGLVNTVGHFKFVNLVAKGMKELVNGPRHLGSIPCSWKNTSCHFFLLSAFNKQL